MNDELSNRNIDNDGEIEGGFSFFTFVLYFCFDESSFFTCPINQTSECKFKKKKKPNWKTTFSSRCSLWCSVLSRGKKYPAAVIDKTENRYNYHEIQVKTLLLPELCEQLKPKVSLPLEIWLQLSFVFFILLFLVFSCSQLPLTLSCLPSNKHLKEALWWPGFSSYPAVNCSPKNKETPICFWLPWDLQQSSQSLRREQSCHPCHVTLPLSLGSAWSCHRSKIMAWALHGRGEFYGRRLLQVRIAILYSVFEITSNFKPFTHSYDFFHFEVKRLNAPVAY